MGISVIDMCHFLTNPNFYGVLIRKESFYCYAKNLNYFNQMSKIGEVLKDSESIWMLPVRHMMTLLS